MKHTFIYTGFAPTAFEYTYSFIRIPLQRTDWLVYVTG